MVVRRLRCPQPWLVVAVSGGNRGGGRLCWWLRMQQEVARGELCGEVVATCGSGGVPASVKLDEEDGDEEHGEARGGDRVKATLDPVRVLPDEDDGGAWRCRRTVGGEKLE
ncbi:hypothetical protein L1987_18502 [Smallanthus sonchifolius]|uniref:Uncharacterized protein n=1 Tax=Smallanthus sonchifolius TaxID=185202 RepID=A0ACB9J243_9ASTR|nr:hypothetical protein L1987_18502 [Smallanthus sonchifolius]